LRGRYSANSEKSRGSAPPSPKPVIMRRKASHQALGANAEARPKIAKMAIVIWKPVLRPIRSESVPQNHAPMSMPRKVDETTRPASPDDRLKSSLKPGSAKAIRKTSAASAAQVTPQTPSSRFWNLPKPIRSMASSMSRAPCVPATRASSRPGATRTTRRSPHFGARFSPTPAVVKYRMSRV
jgi:hypothetical protein